MKNYMENMDQFLAVQQDVMDAYFSRKRKARGGTQAADGPAKSLPFVGEIVSMKPGESCTVKRSMDLREDIFLEDHPFGGEVSAMGHGLRPLIIVPLTVGIEIMTETASLLFRVKFRSPSGTRAPLTGSTLKKMGPRRSSWRQRSDPGDRRLPL